MKIKPRISTTIKSKLNKIITCALAITIILGNPIVVLAQTDAEALSEVQNQKAQTEDKIDNLQGQIDDLQENINALENQISSSQFKIDNLNTQIAQKKSEIEKNKILLGDYIRSMYIDGQRSNIELVLTSNNFSEFIDSAEYKQSMQNKVSETIKNIEVAKTELEKSINAVEIEKSNLLSLKAQAVSQKNGVISQQNQQEYLLNNLSVREKEILARIEERRKNTVVVCSSFDRTDTANFVKPVMCGGISQEWGNTDFSITGVYGYENGKPRIHNGIDIAANRGTAVYSIGRGTVVVAGAQGSWGNTIVIKHDNGYYSRYGHLDSIFVSVGERVNATTQIGALGSTGFSTGPHLHLSVYTPSANYNEYNNWNTVDPLGLFSF